MRLVVWFKDVEVSHTNDHFVSYGSSCEGQISDGFLGYVGDVVAVNRFSKPSSHLSMGSGPNGGTNALNTPPSYTWAKLVIAFGHARGGAVTLYSCVRSANGHTFSSLDPKCEGQRQIGIVANLDASLTGGDMAVHRCWIPGNDDHFDTTAPCENAKGAVDEGVLGYLNTVIIA